MAHSQIKPPKGALQKLCKQGKSHREIAAVLGVSATTVGWWLHAYKLRSVNGTNTRSTKKPKCKVCGTTNPKKFYYGRKSKCKRCWSKSHTLAFSQPRRERRAMLKYAAVQAKGGCCQICGYRGNLAALQFHHPNKDEKHEGWHLLFRSASASSKHARVLAKELQKCILLCANCHAEHHHPSTQMPICVTGRPLTYLSHWIAIFRDFFHT